VLVFPDVLDAGIRGVTAFGKTDAKAASIRVRGFSQIAILVPAVNERRNPAMQQSNVPLVSGSESLVPHLKLLSSIAEGSCAFLSCYLAASEGLAACREFLATDRQRLKQTLPLQQQLGLDEAFAMADEALSRHWRKGLVSMAVFARHGGSDRFLHVALLEEAVASQTYCYRLPQLFPLFALQQASQRYRLLLARRTGLQVLDIDGESARVCAWSGTTTQRDLAPTTQLDGQTLALRRVLSDKSGLALVIAGDEELLPIVEEWLPKRALARTDDLIPVPEYLDINETVEYVRTDRRDRRRLESGLEVSRLIRSMRGRGGAVTGPRATLEALRAGQVETLLLGYSEGSLRDMPAGFLCNACDEPGARDFDADICIECGGEKLSGRDFLAEVAWLVARNGTNIVFSDSDELRYLGGVGCLLNQPVETQVMPRPIAHRRLDLVA
jgi:hypothetical protein